MRAITWVKERGAEFAEVSLGGASLRAAGVAVSADPLPYRLDYELDCADGFVTRTLIVQTRGATWRRRLALSRGPRGVWTVQARADGEADLPPPGGDPAVFARPSTATLASARSRIPCRSCGTACCTAARHATS